MEKPTGLAGVAATAVAGDLAPKAVGLHGVAATAVADGTAAETHRITPASALTLDSLAPSLPAANTDEPPSPPLHRVVSDSGSGVDSLRP